MLLLVPEYKEKDSTPRLITILSPIPFICTIHLDYIELDIQEYYYSASLDVLLFSISSSFVSRYTPNPLLEFLSYI